MFCSISFFLCLFLPNYLQIITVNKETPLEDSRTVQREGGRAEGNPRYQQNQSQVGL